MARANLEGHEMSRMMKPRPATLPSYVERYLGPVRVHPVFFKMMKDAGLNTDNVVEQKPVPMWADGGATAGKP